MKSFFLTDTGRVRDHNEDSVTILKNANNEYLLAVADGMGGHKAGEVASSMAINHITSKFNSLESLGSKEKAINWIREEVAEINNSIFSYTALHEESKGMGTTFVIALYTKDYLLFGNVGDSSGFVIKNSKLYKVTEEIEGVFLCSDGLTSMLNQTQIEKVLDGPGSLEERVTRLIRKSNVRGGTDNISIACLMYNDEEGEL